jgi:hypothetical protein
MSDLFNSDKHIEKLTILMANHYHLGRHEGLHDGLMIAITYLHQKETSRVDIIEKLSEIAIQQQGLAKRLVEDRTETQ